ncbi:MAG: hypothetical protein E6X17_15850 [Sporomusaceae bacterium]|nr:hypothetical protein [Sporomusaceae bacterium]
MHGKKVVIFLGLLAMLATTGGLVWFWWAGSPPKTPARSRSVKIERSVMPEPTLVPRQA